MQDGADVDVDGLGRSTKCSFALYLYLVGVVGELDLACWSAVCNAMQMHDADMTG